VPSGSPVPEPTATPFGGADLVYVAINPGGRVVPFDARTNTFGAPMIAPPIPRERMSQPNIDDFNVLANGSYCYVLWAATGNTRAGDRLVAYALDGSHVTHAYPPTAPGTAGFVFSGTASHAAHVWTVEADGGDARLRVASPDLATTLARGPIASEGVIADLADPTGDDSYVFDGTGTGRILRGTDSDYRYVGPALTGAFGLIDRVRGTNYPTLAIAPDGTALYAADLRSVSVIDPHAMRRTASVPIGEPAHGIAVSRDNARVYVLGERFDHKALATVEKSVTTIDTLSDRVVSRRVVFRNTDPVHKASPYTEGFAVTPDGSELLLASRDEIVVLDAETGAERARVRTPQVSGTQRSAIVALAVPTNAEP